jgi:hypothetical protein
VEKAACAEPTVDPEILGSRVCGGSKIAKKKKIRKMLDLLQLPLDASPLANTLLMNSLLFTTGLSELKYRRKQAKSTWKCCVASGFDQFSSGCSSAHLDHEHWHSPTISSSSELREHCKVIWVEGWIGLE